MNKEKISIDVFMKISLGIYLPFPTSASYTASSMGHGGGENFTLSETIENLKSFTNSG